MQGRPTLLAVFVCQILASILIVKLLSLYHFIKILQFPLGLTTLFVLLSLIVLDLLILVPYLSLSTMSK
jgi:hypothetical protein